MRTFLRRHRSVQLVVARRAALNDLLMSLPVQRYTITKKGSRYTSGSVLYFTPSQSRVQLLTLFMSPVNTQFSVPLTNTQHCECLQRSRATGSEGAQNSSRCLHSPVTTARLLLHWQFPDTAAAPAGIRLSVLSEFQIQI